MNRDETKGVNFESSQQIAKRTLKDSVFINAFKEKGMVLELYKDLHRDDNDVTVDDVDIVTLSNVLIDGPVNDLGMVVKNTVMCLVEAQTTRMSTILLRSLIYLSRTMEQYLLSRDMTTYTARADNVPNWEIYIIYSEKAGLEGGAQIWRFDTIHSDLFDLNDKEILPIPDFGIVEEYVDICRTIDRIIIAKGYEKDAVNDLMSFCRQKNGVLSQYIISREAEIMGLYEEMWTREGSIRAREKEIRRISLEEGRAEGRAEGMAGALASIQKAIDMLDRNEPIEKIMESTGLTEDVMRSLSRSL